MRIGLKYAVYSAISSYTEGSAITYGTGIRLSPAIAANITKNYRSTEIYGDDILQDRDNGLTDISISFEATEVEPAARVAMLGEMKVGSTDEYEVGDVAAPFGGFGFISVKRNAGTTTYEAFWFYKTQWQEDSIENSTKQKDITFGTPKLTATAYAVVQESAGTAKHYAHQVFSTEAAAVSYLKGKANIT